MSIAAVAPLLAFIVLRRTELLLRYTELNFIVFGGICVDRYSVYQVHIFWAGFVDIQSF